MLGDNAPDHSHQGMEYGDRKSTRLNSSHTVISYAVFCLKKKKEAIARQCRNTHRRPPTDGVSLGEVSSAAFVNLLPHVLLVLQASCAMPHKLLAPPAAVT